MSHADRWEPISPPEAALLLQDARFPWWVAGGWALDLFLGRRTRPHGDIDIAVPRYAQPELARRLQGWEIGVRSDGEVRPWRSGDWLEGGRRHLLWARDRRSDGWMLEFLLEEGWDDWAFRWDTHLHMPWAFFGRRSRDGIPYVAPQVALLYKSVNPGTEKNQFDFAHTVRRLDGRERSWLRRALEVTWPGHPWLSRLQ